MVKKEASENPSSREKPEVSKKESAKFGTLKGVLVPSLLTILGVIMYLRLGWSVGHVGLVPTIIIVSLASLITFLTGLSIAATATNMKIGVGGAYYMISRSFGLEIGAAIGVPLFLAQSLGVAFYLSGFAESVFALFPEVPMLVYGLGALALIGFLAYTSADLALKTQFFVLSLIIISLVSFFLGSEVTEVSSGILDEENVGFWMAFAVIFPAVTGIEAGISLSGDLKSPGKSLPMGTLGAIGIGFIVYVAVAVFLSMNVSVEVLKSDPMVMQKVSIFGPLIYFGLWSATISSGMGALLGAPRTLQALARDRVLPRFLSKGHGPRNDPRIATMVTIIVAATALVFADLNTIAPFLSMFFLTSYGILNLIAGTESLLKQPSWRPKFKVFWGLSIAGALACFASMVMINAGVAILSFVFCVLVYIIMSKRNLKKNWFDIRRGMLKRLTRFAVYEMAQGKENARSWQPNVMLLSDSPTPDSNLVRFGDDLTHHSGIMTVATIVAGDNYDQDRIDNLEKAVFNKLQGSNIPALSKISFAKNFVTGAQALIENYGLGQFEPNIFLMELAEDEKNHEAFVEILDYAVVSKRNLVLLRNADRWPSYGTDKALNVNTWWGGKSDNIHMMLALLHVLQLSREWAEAKISLRCLADSEEAIDGLRRKLNELVDKARIEIQVEVILREDKPRFQQISEVSKDSDFIFLGIDAEPEGNLLEAYQKILRKTQNFPTTVFFMANEEVDFDKLFDD